MLSARAAQQRTGCAMVRGSQWLAGLCVLALLSGTACAKKKSSKSMDAEFQAIGNKAMADFNAGADCSAELEQAAEVQTGGCAGFEAFSVDDGPPMLAVANFWDGRSLPGACTACALAPRRS